MQKKAPDSTKRKIKDEVRNEVFVDLSELKELARDWMLDGELQQFSPKTISERKAITSKLFWFCERQCYQQVSVREIKAFLHHLATGHTESGGRFGMPRLTQPLRPVSLRGWYVVLAAWFKWCHVEGFIDADFMAGVKKPRAQTEIKPPLSPEQLAKILDAAKAGLNPQRDVAILLLLLDTGLRASELLSLQVCDVDLANRSLIIVGKGNKKRGVFMGRQATKALILYLRTTRRQPTQPLFYAQAGVNAGEPMKIHGLQQLMTRLAKRAGVEGPCSPHALRRSFACSFLKAGGNVFALQSLLGHSDLTMTRRYCRIAEADLQEQHAKFSPADLMRGR